MVKQSECQKQRHHSRLSELQSRCFFAVFGDGGLHHALDAVAAQATVVADTFDFEQSPVDLSTDLLQIGQVGQSFVDSEIVRVAKRSFRPATAPFFEVLFQVEVLVVDMQARVHAVLDHPGAELAWGFLPYHSVENQLHTVRASQIQVVTDDLFEEPRPRSGRSKICVKLTSICQIDSSQS